MTVNVNAGAIPVFELHDRLRKARELTGLDQGEFAEELGLSRNSVGAAERGDTKPRRITMRAWSLRTGVSLHWLQTGEAPSPSGGDGASNVSLLPESNRRPSYYNVTSSLHRPTVA